MIAKGRDTSVLCRMYCDSTNLRGSGVDGLIRYAKPDRRTHTAEAGEPCGLGNATTTGGTVRYSYL
jgi:hypothetical protein